MGNGHKISIGKLHLQNSFDAMFPQQLDDNGIEIAGITLEHLNVVCELPFHHRDPFDRLLIAQAQVDRLPIISADEMFDAYGIAREW